MRCINCGNATDPRDAFCENCGQKNEEPSPALCMHCGQPAEDGDVFCYYCGKKLAGAGGTPPVVVNTTPAHSPAYSLCCSKCGTPLETGEVFCGDCGQKVGGGAAPPTTNTTTGYAPTPAAMGAPIYTPPPQPAAYTPPSPPARKPRMPLIFLLDTSGATAPYINQLNTSLNRFKSEVCRDGQTQDILDVAVVQFNDSVNVLQDFLPVENMKPTRLIAGGSAYYSAPVRESVQMLRDYLRNQPDYYKPWVILVSGSNPADDITAAAGEVQSMQGAGKLRFMSLGVQGYNAAALKQLTDVVFRMDGTDFTSFFDWIKGCMWAIARTSPSEKPQLPPLEGNVYRDK